MLSKLGSLLYQSLLQLLPPLEDILFLLLDVSSSVMLGLDQLVRVRLQRLNLLLLVADGLVEVFVLLDHCLNIVLLAVSLIVSLEESLPGSHPVFSLLAVAVIQLELQALVELHPPRNPGLLQILSRLVHSLQLLLDFSGGKVVCLEQLLPKELKGLERSRACVDLSAMFLVPLKESFSSGDISGKLVRADEALHAAHPGHQVPVVGEEPLQVVGVQELHLAQVALGREVSPLLVDVLLFLIDHLGALSMRVHQLAGLLVELVDLIAEGGKVPLKPLVLPLEGLHRSHVLANVIAVEGLVLLGNPVLGLVDIPVEHLHLVHLLEGIALLLGHLL